MQKKPMRLFRPQPPEFFPSPDVVAMYDRENEIIHYDKELYDTLSNEEKHKIHTLHDDMLLSTTAHMFSF